MASYSSTHIHTYVRIFMLEDGEQRVRRVSTGKKNEFDYSEQYLLFNEQRYTKQIEKEKEKRTKKKKKNTGANFRAKKNFQCRHRHHLVRYICREKRKKEQNECSRVKTLLTMLSFVCFFLFMSMHFIP